MKLKRIEIIGFKSFVEKTILTFDKDISTIVGPNGCGKSNIVDAIRWVMGEQSAKHLRGKLMEDVIFAGSATRPQLSMASVELTFSTEGYQTPAQYLNHPEISICRRLFRTGDSEYLINKVPVRLKDITELFLGTGIGTKAYSVIEQGRVGQIVTAKPEDRRFYIEEVAGITKFKTRKEAALRKMEATSQNLLRLNDLVIEIERQMRSFDRQAKKAEKYRKIKEEFQKWDLGLSSNLYAEATQKQNELESELRSFDEKEAQLKSQLQERENEIEVSRLELMENEKTINEIQNNLFEVTNYVRLAENTLRHKKDEQESLSKTIREIQVDVRELKNESQGITNGLDQINEQKLLTDFEEETLKEQVDGLEGDVHKEQNELLALKSDVDKTKENIHIAESRLGQIEALRHHEVHKQEELKGRIESDETELDQLKKKYNQLQKIFREAHESLHSLKQLKLDLSSKTDEIIQELEQHRVNLKAEEVELTNLKEELTLRRSRLASLEELQKNFEGYQEGTRSVLLQKKELGNEGIFGTVADFVETDPRYEGAVSAVLGEKLQYVVVKSQQEGIEAVDYLCAGAHGRSSFIPMQVRSYQTDAGEIPAQEGVLGPLKNFVNVKAEYNHLSEFLFGDIVLVDDLKKALDIWSSNGHRKKLVTLNGEVVDPTGVITGGSLANTSKALLEKKREMKELSILIGQLQEELTKKEETRTLLADRVRSLEASLDTVKHSTFEEEIKIANQEKDVSHFRKDMELFKEKQNELLRRLSSERESLEIIQPALDALTKEEGELNSSLEISREVLSKKTVELENRQKIFDDQSQKLTRMKIEMAQAHERNVHLQSEIDRLQEEAYRLRLSMVDRSIAELVSIARKGFLEREMDHVGKTLDKKLKNRTTIEQGLKEQKEAYEKSATTIQEKEASLKEMRQVHEEAAKRLSEVTITLTEVRGQMKHLVEQCLERHQLNLPEEFESYRDENLNEQEAAEKVATLREQLTKMGDVNTAALQEYEELKGRFEFLSKHKEDLEASLRSLERVIQKINRTTKERFVNTFHLVNEKFQTLFPKLFRGGKAKLLLTDENNLLETGVEIVAQPPGKKLQSISLLSGGEKALTAVSLIFAIFQIKPSPFCILDEVDAPLDDANVTRYNDTLREMTPRTQFIVITHNKKTMEMADVLYGVTMQDPGVSQIVSVELN